MRLSVTEFVTIHTLPSVRSCVLPFLPRPTALSLFRISSVEIYRSEEALGGKETKREWGIKRTLGSAVVPELDCRRPEDTERP